MATDLLSLANARRLALALGNVLVAGLLLAAVMIFLAPLWWFAELFTHFRAQGAVAGVALALLFFALSAPKRGALALVLAVGHVVAVAPAYMSSGPGRDLVGVADGLPRFRLLSANVLTENTEHGAFLAFVRAEAPDALMVVEVGPEWARDLETLADLFPVRRFEPREDNFGVAVLARDPRAVAEIVDCGPAGVPSTRLRLPVSGTDTVVTLLSTHPMPPIGQAAAAERDAQLAACVRLLSEAAPGPRVLTGDLNLTPFAPGFDALLVAGRLFDSRAGFGLQASWLVDFPLLSVPIDHALHSAELVVLDRRVGPDVGSDHRPIVVDFALAPTPP